MIIFARTVNPEAEIESLPHLTYIQNLRVVLHTVGEAIGVLQLSEFDNWDQLFTDATSIQRLSIQGLIIACSNERGGTKSKAVLGGAGVIIEKGESADAVKDCIKSTILNSARHLDGLAKIAEEVYPDYKHDFKPRSAITLAKFLGGHVTTDSCAPAQKTNSGLVEDFVEAARGDWEVKKTEEDALREANGGELPEGVAALPPLKVYSVLCWHHLRCVWFGGIDQELSKYLREQFQDELKAIDEGMVEASLGNYNIQDQGDAQANQDTDRVDASIRNVARAVEKLFCPKGLYEKGDQMEFAQFMIDEFPGVLLMHLERACSGSRMDICCEAALAILVNRKYYLVYLQRRILWNRDKKKNKLIRALQAILASRRMTACLRVMCIFDVAIVKKHRMFAGKSDKLHKDCPDWKGCASMCDIADGIYDALVKLEACPEKFLDNTFMLSIFDKWKAGNPQEEAWHT